LRSEKMEFEKINRNTYFINAPTNVGVYSFKNKNALIIDTGTTKYDAKKTEAVLLDNGLNPKYIFNTHGHVDHCGGNRYFKDNYPGVEIFSSESEKVFIENPNLLPILTFSAFPAKRLKYADECTVNYVITDGIKKINDEKFEFQSFPGHNTGDMVITTPDRVTFLGDALFSEYTLLKHPLPYLINIALRVESLKALKEKDSDYFVISHCDEILDKKSFLRTVDKNLEVIEKTKKEITDICSQPLSREEILQEFSVYHNLEMGYKSYMINLCGLSAFINNLLDENIIDCSVQDMKLVYYAK